MNIYCLLGNILGNIRLQIRKTQPVEHSGTTNWGPLLVCPNTLDLDEPSKAVSLMIFGVDLPGYSTFSQPTGKSAVRNLGIAFLNLWSYISYICICIYIYISYISYHLKKRQRFANFMALWRGWWFWIFFFYSALRMEQLMPSCHAKPQRNGWLCFNHHYL